ncbi:acyl-CoA thioesterase domain-containing protein [Nocardia africana]|uniref:Acyl-CoA thioesterase-like N-terminal HotDog domain-containing protein n=1 Tax=Nocardia africana TaxID=134964 RepID=A0A378X2Z3_9NOCA|nr:acyl-CoA thioesterase domain-containing protein [Nocardia africana]MCC3311823.1 thioesterase family protein [Nocardia africana]SUA46903.1 Uncharacterised protein [Nocardia africana]
MRVRARRSRAGAPISSVPGPALQPVRWTLDLFRAVRMRPTATSATVVREGPRLCLVDAVLRQDGQPAARASALYLRASEAPPA